MTYSNSDHLNYILFVSNTIVQSKQYIAMGIFSTFFPVVVFEDLINSVNPFFPISGIFFVLHWRLSPTQMRCTCDTYDSTHILYDLLIKVGHNIGIV